MKQLLFIALFAIASISAFAQISLSANVACTLNGYTYKQQNLAAYNEALPSGHSFEAHPKLGFAVSDKLCLGVELGYLHSVSTTTSGIYNPNQGSWDKQSSDQMKNQVFSAGLFARYQVHDFGRLSVHAELAGVYGFNNGLLTSTQTAGSDDLEFCRDIISHQMSVQLVPVFVYSFGNRFSMDVYLNFASLVFTRDNTQISGLYKKGYRFDHPAGTETTTYALDLGIRTRTTTLLSLGFTYAL